MSEPTTNTRRPHYLRLSYIPKLGGPAKFERYATVFLPESIDALTQQDFNDLQAELTAAIVSLVTKLKAKTA